MPAPKHPRSMFAYPWDLHDDGIELALDAIEKTARFQGVTLAVAYHLATCFLPHNPRRKVFFAEDGMVLFRPDEARWRQLKLQPRVSEVVESEQWLPRLVERIRKRGLQWTAWVVYLYNHHLARSHPECARRDALGNVYPTQLCPANPDVRAYVRALTREVLALKPDAVHLESLSYLPFSYGFLNPKVLTPLSPRAELLLGLCFCDHCLKASSKGLNTQHFQEEVAGWLERHLPQMPDEEEMAPVSEEWYSMAFESHLQHFLAARVEVVCSLVEEVVRMIRKAGDIAIESPWTAPADMLRTGLLAPRINKLLDRVSVPVPVTAEDVSAYRRGLGKDARVLASLQPSHVSSAAELTRALKGIQEAGVDGLTFYNYGLVRQSQLQWLGDALKEQE